jgi:hypothetical protein
VTSASNPLWMSRKFRRTNIHRSFPGPASSMTPAAVHPSTTASAKTRERKKKTSGTRYKKTHDPHHVLMYYRNSITTFVFPPEILSQIIKDAGQNAPHTVVLCSGYSWAALQGLYERVELKTLQQASNFFISIKNKSTIREILNQSQRNGREHPALATLVKTLYISFDSSRNPHFAKHKIDFYPLFKRCVPALTNLEDMVFDVCECIYKAVGIMIPATMTYPTSVRTLRLVSTGIDFHKVSLTTLLPSQNNPSNHDTHRNRANETYAKAMKSGLTRSGPSG